jgi:hypothetical protein
MCSAFVMGFWTQKKAWLTTEMMSTEEMDTVITKTNRVLAASEESVLVDRLDCYKKGLIPFWTKSFVVALDEHDEHVEQWTESPGLELAQCGGN